MVASNMICIQVFVNHAVNRILSFSWLPCAKYVLYRKETFVYDVVKRVKKCGPRKEALGSHTSMP